MDCCSNRFLKEICGTSVAPQGFGHGAAGTLQTLTFIPPPLSCGTMVGEGCGRHPDYDTLIQTLFNYQSEDVAAVGELVLDQVIPLNDIDDRYRSDMEDADWFPAAGESRISEEVPDYVADLSADTYPGGRSPNQATAAALSGAGTAFYGTSGPGSDPLLSELAETGVDVDDVAYDAAKQESTCYVFVEDDGENRISFMRGTSTPDTDYIESHVAGTDADYLLLHNGEPTATIEHVLDTLEEHDDGPSVVFDPAPADGAGRWLDYDCVDIVTPNTVEYTALEDVLADYDGTVIQTSADGATVNTNGEMYHVPSPDVDVVDTTGAGDTFNGYLAGCLSQGMDMKTSAEYAVHAASLSVTEEGAQPSMPSFEEVKQFMEGSGGT